MIINGYWGEKESEQGVVIDSCGHIFTFHGREINRPDGRENYLLLYIHRGEARFYFREREEICTSGDFILYAPHEAQHHIYEANESGEFYYIHFTTAEKWWLELLGMRSQMPYHSAGSSELCDIFEEIIGELQNRERDYQKICVAMLGKLFLKINRLIYPEPKKPASGDIRFVIGHITQKYYENTSLEGYAKLCGLSKFHFLHKFRQMTGVTPIQYRNHIRIERAKELLTKTGMNVNMISEKLGYTAPEYFSSAFRRKVGCSPMSYRRVTGDI